MTRVLILQGHPTPGGGNFCHGLGEAYAAGAREAGHEVRTILTGDIDVPLISSTEEWRTAAPPPEIAAAQEDILWAEHLVLIYPLWLGDVPARFKGFLEQAIRPTLIGEIGRNGKSGQRLAGRSARVIVTMGMPGWFYRLYYCAHSLKSLKRNVLQFVGISPVRTTVVGGVDRSADYRRGWIARVRALGAGAR